MQKHPSASESAVTPAQARQDRPSAQEVITAAAALPPDFQADVLLRVAGSDDVPVPNNHGDRDSAVVGLGEQAYALAQHATRKLPGLATVGYAGEENEDELRSARTAGLDQLTLQTRAISIMKSRSPGRAVALLPGLPRPAVATCESDYVDDPTPIYTLLPTLSVNDASRSADLLLGQVDRARSEAEIAPALKSVIALPLGSTATEAAIAQRLTKMLLRARGDDASFTATELSVASDIQLALQRIESIPGVHSQLRSSYRDYVEAHLSAPRCAASLAGNHRLLEQRFVAELPNDRISEPASPAPSNEPEVDAAVSLIRQAGYNVRTQLLGYVGQEPLRDTALAAASKEFLDQIETGPLREAAASDGTGRIQRAQLIETLRYLEYAPAGGSRERGFALLDGLLDGAHYRRDHDVWFGDLKRVADQSMRWHDRELRLRHLSASTIPVIRVYAMLMQRKQFP
ncbi:hypothetical protein [Xanthomonas pisi]|nr:hypothetical protein [Xanthomonas pisi]